MRTERLILFGTHFFCVLKRACFLHTWAFDKFLCYFAMSIRDNKAPKSMIELTDLSI